MKKFLKFFVNAILFVPLMFVMSIALFYTSITAKRSIQYSGNRQIQIYEIPEIVTYINNFLWGTKQELVDLSTTVKSQSNIVYVNTHFLKHFKGNISLLLVGLILQYREYPMADTAAILNSAVDAYDRLFNDEEKVLFIPLINEWLVANSEDAYNFINKKDQAHGSQIGPIKDTLTVLLLLHKELGGVVTK